MDGVPAASGFAPAATGHQPGSLAAWIWRRWASERPWLRASDFQPDDMGFSTAATLWRHWASQRPWLGASDFQPNDMDMREALRQPAREAAIAAEAAADEEEDVATSPYEAVEATNPDVGGDSTPVVVTNLTVGDVFPRTLRYTVPSVRRVEEELHRLVVALPGERARLLLRMCHWPKLLEAVLTQEKNAEQKQRARDRRQRARDFFAPGGWEQPTDVATSPYEEVEATNPDVGGNEADVATSPYEEAEMRPKKRSRLNGKQHTAGSASASSAAAASSAPSASCAAAAAGLASDDDE